MKTQRYIKLALNRASGLGLCASGVSFGLLCQRKGPGGKSLRAPGRRAKIGLRVAR
jgi:hypothetical protein